MRVLFYLFSGTGNTNKVCQLYQRAFEQEGHTVDIFDIDEHCIEQQPCVELARYDLCGFFYPIYAFNAPQNIVDFIKNIPVQSMESKTPCFIITSSGEPLNMNYAARFKIQKAIKRQPLVLIAQYNYVMPYNIIFRHSDERAYQMITTAKALIPIEAKEIISIASGTTTSYSLPKVSKLEHLISFFLRIESWGGRIIGRFYKVTDACTKCGLCIKWCPVKNISASKDNTPIFGKKCLICQRCSMYCPTNAIKTGLLHSWKVHKPYTFNKPTEPAPTNDKSARYLRKSYENYFREAEKKISQYNLKNK